MNYAIIEFGKVTNIVTATAQFAAQNGWVSAEGAAIGDLWDGEKFTPAPPPVKPPEEVKAEIVTATQQRLDDFAKTRNYDGILSLCTYATSTVSKFKAEGQYGVEARDATWSKLYEMLAEVEGGTRPMPTSFADVEPDLPALVWPTQPE